MGRLEGAVVALLSAPFLLLALLGLPSRTGWDRLRAVDPSLGILDHPRLLLEVASTYEGPSGPPTEHPSQRKVDTRLEALKALLMLQDFKVRMARFPVGKGTGAEGAFVHLKSAAPDRLVLIATLSEKPDLPGRHPWLWQERRKTDYEDYWSMDLLEFDRSGRLMNWSPYVVR